MKAPRSRLDERPETPSSPIAIALASAKGGTGKTTLTTALAVQAANDGERVALLDWEPQASLSLWWHMRGKPANPALISGAEDPVEAIRGLVGLFDWVFLDTSPAYIDQIRRAVMAVDFVLIPVQASAFDLMAARVVISMCGELGRPFAFMLNREHARRKTLNGSAAVHLRKFGVLLTESVRDLAAHVSALNMGKAGSEHPDSKQAGEARRDIEPLWVAVKELAIKVRSR